MPTAHQRRQSSTFLLILKTIWKLKIIIIIVGDNEQ